MTLQFPSDATQDTAIDPNHLARVRSFVSDNADELIFVAEAAAGHNGSAAAKDLLDSVLSGDAPADLLHDLLVVVRDALRDSSGSARHSRGNGRSDMDAAVRWFGARLDDLLWPMS